MEITVQELAEVIEAVGRLEEVQQDLSGFTTTEFAKAHPGLDPDCRQDLRKARGLLVTLKSKGSVESHKVRRPDCHGVVARRPGWRYTG